MASFTIEEKKPFKDSILWDLQRAFYDQHGVEAWTRAIVPHFVTSNSFIAKCYAKYILSFLRDWFLNSPAADSKKPVHIVEIGAGHAKLAYLIVKHLLSMAEFFPRGISKPAFKYIVTDVSEDNIKVWADTDLLKPLIELGVLDFAVFDVEKTESLYLINSKTRISRNTMKSPMVVVANYILDTLRQDAFRIKNLQLQQALITIKSSQEEANLNDPGILQRMSYEWHYEDCSPADVDNEIIRSLLERYVESKQDCSFLIPIGGLEMITKLCLLSNGKTVVLCGDKAMSKEDDLRGERNPHIALHGSFSCMVNFHAVKSFTTNNGGWSLLTPYTEGFKCGSFIFGIPRQNLPETRFTWCDVFETFGPENFSNLQRCIKDETPAPPGCSVKLALSTIRLSQWESDVFYKFKQVLLDKAPYSSEKQKADVYADMLAVYDNFYPVHREKDVPFEIGRIFMGLKRYNEAVAMFRDSLKYFSEHHVTWYNLGICYYYLSDLITSQDCFNTTLKLQPEYTDAESWKRRIQSELTKDTAAAQNK